MQNDFDHELQNYFTDVEHLRGMFKQWLAAPTLPKRLLIVHGVGGVGKSSLLRMFRLHCKSVGVPVALASGDEQKSAVEVLTRWADDLKADGVRLPEFDKTFQQYRAIQAKVENEATKVAGKLAKGAAATVVETVASTIPGIGPLVGKLGGMGAEALVDWLRGFLTKPDIDLLLDPAKKLTADFLADLQEAADRRRIVLMLDTFEQMTALEDWTREVAQQLPANVLLVIAGRALPNWSRAWAGWMASAQVEELKPMSEDDMRELVRRYYAMLRGGEPDPKQVEAIIRFARGLPMVVTSAVQLWVRYPDTVGDLQAIKPYVVADLVDRLMEGVPKAMVPALESAAVVRWFDQPILRAVMGQEDVREVYDELRRFPFVRTRAEGLALHDAVREMIDENLHVQDAERHCELHERAAAYFENRIGQLRAIPGLSDEWQRLALETAYHLLRVDEDGGMNLLHKLFEQGLTYFRYQFCHSLLNEAESLPIKDPKSIHRLKYNRIRLKVAEFSPAFVSDQEFTELVKGSDLDPETKWEVLLNYAWFLGFTRQDYKAQAEYYQKSLDALQAIGQEESTAGCLVLSAIASSLGDEPIKKEEFAKRALEISQRIGELFYAYSAYVELGHLYLDTGEYAKSEEMWRAAVALAQRFQNDARIADSLNRLAHALMAQGKLGEAEEVLNSAMEAAKRLPDTLGAGQDKGRYIKRHFGILYQMRGEYDKAIESYSDSVQIYRQARSIGGRLRTLGLLANCLYEAGRYDQIEQLRPEVESLMPKMQSNEIVASWLIVQGHMLLDDALEHKVDLSVAIEKYCDTLKVALEGNHIIALDEMLNRIFWKLEKVIAIGKRQEAILVLQGLLRYWKEGRSGTRLLKELESEQRQKFIGPARENWVLTRIESALTQGVPKCKPAPWLAY